MTSCRSCLHWQPNSSGIDDCAQHVNGAPLLRECELYEYEPGTDEEPTQTEW